MTSPSIYPLLLAFSSCMFHQWPYRWCPFRWIISIDQSGDEGEGWHGAGRGGEGGVLSFQSRLSWLISKRSLLQDRTSNQRIQAHHQTLDRSPGFFRGTPPLHPPRRGGLTILSAALAPKPMTVEREKGSDRSYLHSASHPHRRAFGDRWCTSVMWLGSRGPGGGEEQLMWPQSVSWTVWLRICQ